MSNQLQNVFKPKSLDEAQKMISLICESDLVPTEYRGKNKMGNALAAIMYGTELNLAPLQALQSIAVINGKPSVYGDALIGLVQSHPAYESIEETLSKTKDGLTAICTITRKGAKPHTVTFSEADAQKAGLWGRKGPWTSYPKRMLQMRARGFACRDQFADALKGIITAEEAQDYEIIDVTPKESKPHDAINVNHSEDQLYVEYKDMINGCESEETLKALGEDIVSFPKETKENLKSVYLEKLKSFNKG